MWCWIVFERVWWLDRFDNFLFCNQHLSQIHHYCLLRQHALSFFSCTREQDQHVRGSTIVSYDFKSDFTAIWYVPLVPTVYLLKRALCLQKCRKPFFFDVSDSAFGNATTASTFLIRLFTRLNRCFSPMITVVSHLPIGWSSLSKKGRSRKGINFISKD